MGSEIPWPLIAYAESEANIPVSIAKTAGVNSEQQFLGRPVRFTKEPQTFQPDYIPGRISIAISKNGDIFGIYEEPLLS